MKRIVALVVATLVILGGSGAAALAKITSSVNLRPAYAEDGVLTVLVLGSDVGPPYRPGDLRRGRADAVHLVAVDVRRRKATIVDIPRDSWIGGDKVNAHLTYGGPEGMVRVLEGYTGVGIDYYALTSFRGFEKMTGAMRGVTVNVDMPLHDRDANSNLAPGRQRLNPPQALAYVRDRKSLPDGDFGRSRHQGNYLRFVHRQLRREDNDLADLLRLAGTFARNTVTNIPTSRLVPLALLALDIHPKDVRQVALGGSIGTTSGGASIVHLAPGDTFQRIRRGDIGP